MTLHQHSAKYLQGNGRASARANSILQSSGLQKAVAAFDNYMCYYNNGHIVYLKPDWLAYDW